MATRRFDIDYDARVGTDGGTNSGAGACDHLPWGDGGGFEYQSLFKLVHDWDNMTDVTNVQVYYRNSDEYHLVRGGAGDRQFRLQPISGGWNSAGTASHPMTPTNDVVYGDVSVATGYQTGPHGVSDVSNDWNDFDETEAFRYFAPASINFPGGAGQGNTNRGFRIIADDDSPGGDSGEFWARNKGAGYAIYAIVTYTNHGDVHCAITDPVDDGEHRAEESGGTYASPLKSWDGTSSCDEGHSITNIQVQVDNNSDFSSTIIDDSTGETIDPILGDWTNLIGSAACPRGTTLYTRARATCTAGVVSDWSDTIHFIFTDADVPVLDGTASQVMEASVTGTDTGPRAIISWTYSDPQGMAQLQYKAIMYADDGSTVLEDSGWLTSGEQFHRFDTYAIVRGTFYKFTVETRNTDSISAGASAMLRLKAQWGLYNQYKLLAGTPTSWRFTNGFNEPANTRINIQHSSSASSTPGTWRENLDDVGFNTHYHVRFWLFAWHGATTPTVNTYSLHANLGIAVSADKWTLATGASLAGTKYVLGSRSLKMACLTANTRISYSQAFAVLPNTEYILSGRASSVGNSGGYYRVVDTTRTTILVSTNVLTATSPLGVFETLYSTPFTTGAAQTSVVVECVVTGATGNDCYFDCVQLEPGTVVGHYRPGQVGLANVVDMGGVQIDAYAGGTFRVRGSQGDANSVTELGVMGLEPGVISFREVTAPATPASGKVHVYAKSDGLIYRKDDAGTETALGGGGGMTFGSPVPTGTANADGSGTDAAREDHVHEHSWYEGSVWTWDADVTSSGALANVKTYNFFAATTINNLIMPRSGTIIALAVRVNAARTTGSLRFNVRNNTAGANLTLSATLDGTNTTNAYGWGAPGDAGNTFSAGDALSFRSEVTVATYAPITADVQIFAVFAFDD
jgi:hypothetical protein